MNIVLSRIKMLTFENFVFPLAVFLLFVNFYFVYSSTHGDGVILPTKCETCKYVALELEQRFEETGKTNEILQTSSSIMIKGKTKPYRISELRLIETLEDVCERILKYNMHKEHENSKRFAKGQSQTMKVLHDLVDKGVKVELGIPYELWDSPSVEVTTMKQYCESIVEEYENEIERWYRNEDVQKPSLLKYLCQDRVLKTTKDRECLFDVDNTKSKKKGDVGTVVDKTKKQAKKESETTFRKTAAAEDNTTEKKKKNDDNNNADVIQPARKVNKKGDDEL